jgi:hypothetical protein
VAKKFIGKLFHARPFSAKRRTMSDFRTSQLVKPDTPKSNMVGVGDAVGVCRGRIYRDLLSQRLSFRADVILDGRSTQPTIITFGKARPSACIVPGRTGGEKKRAKWQKVARGAKNADDMNG